MECCWPTEWWNRRYHWNEWSPSRSFQLPRVHLASKTPQRTCKRIQQWRKCTKRRIIGNLLWQDAVQKRFRFLLLLFKLIRPFQDKAFQVVRVLFHHGKHVVEDIGFPGRELFEFSQRKELWEKCDSQSGFHFFESSSDGFEIRPQFRRFLPAILHASDDVIFAIQLGQRRPESFVKEPLGMFDAFDDIWRQGTKVDTLNGYRQPLGSSPLADMVLSKLPHGPLRPTISYKMMPKEKTSPFWEPRGGGLGLRSNSGALHSKRLAQGDLRRDSWAAVKRIPLMYTWRREWSLTWQKVPFSSWRPKSVICKTQRESTRQLDDLRLPCEMTSLSCRKIMPCKPKHKVRLFENCAGSKEKPEFTLIRSATSEAMKIVSSLKSGFWRMSSRLPRAQ